MDRFEGYELAALTDCIRMASAGSKGCSLVDQPFAWTDVLSAAATHNVVPLVSCAIMCSQDLSCPDPLKERMLDIMRDISSKNAIRKQRMLHLVHEIENAGISVQMLKGYSVSRLYAYPESRESVDHDLLVDLDQEKRVYDFLSARGFSVKERRLTANEGVCQHKKYGVVEVHVSLYPEIVENAWKSFIDIETLVQEHPVRIDTIDGSFYTLGHTDQLLFLVLHMAKHFIESGLTIRMMIDIALHFSKHKTEINASRFWETISKMKCDTLVNCLLWVMVEYGGYSTDDFPGMSKVKPEQIACILEDLKTGGYMGNKEITERYESGMEYHRQLLLKRKSPFRYVLYMLGWKLRSGANNMFPSYQRLIDKYPFVSKLPLIAPFVWFYHLACYTFKKLWSGVLQRDIRSKNSTVHEVSKKRIDLFKKLEMI